MTDITKCANSKHCERAKDCYRHTATSNRYRQSWAAFYEPDKKCLAFWSNKDFRQQQRVNK